LIAVLGLVALETPASAKASKPPKFVGAAPGSATCSFSAKVKLSPPLTKSGGGTNPSRVKGTLSSCTVSDGTVTIAKGKMTGSFASSPLSCATLTSTGAMPTLTIKWKGGLNGAVGSTAYAGRARFTQTMVRSNAATGSFAGDASLTVDVPSNWATLCGAPNGLKKATVSGTLVLGPPIGAASHVVSDGAGYCTLLPSTAVDCWGDNAHGELGNDTTTAYSDIPTPVSGIGGSGTLAGVASITSVGDFSYGYSSYCAVLTSGGVDCWGYGAYGVLGNGSTVNSNVPVAVKAVGGSGTLIGVASVASDGYYSYCAVLKSGGVDCWGFGADGVLGNGSTVNSNVPVAVKAVGGSGNLTGVASVASEGPNLSDGDVSYCAVLTSGGVDCWGTNGDGVLGNGTVISYSDVPVAVSGIGGSGTLTGVASVASDGDYSHCARLNAGSVDCWGYGADGGLGDGSTAKSDVPVAVSGIGGSGTLSGVANLASDGLFSYCALTSGAVDCWGYNNVGELGNGSTVNSNVPVAVKAVGGSGTLSGVANLASDGLFSYCALTSGAVDCWGYGVNGVLGNGSTANSNVPVAVSGIGGSGTLTGVASVVSDGYYSYCAVMTSGAVDCWGYGAKGVLGNGSTASSATPVPVFGIGP